MTNPIDEDEPIGYDGFGAPLYDHQVSRVPHAAQDVVNDTIRRMMVDQGPPLPIALGPGWKDVGHLSEDGLAFFDGAKTEVKWRDTTPKIADLVRIQEAAVRAMLSTHDALEVAVPGLQIHRDVFGTPFAWVDEITSLESYQRQFVNELVRREDRAFSQMYGIPLRARPFCEHEIPSMGTE